MGGVCGGRVCVGGGGVWVGYHSLMKADHLDRASMAMLWNTGKEG